MRLRSPLALAASFALLTLSARAGAQSTPPDVVKLHDGSMFRGTISELVANDHVDIVLANGQTHHFAMKDVTYAGSAASSEPPAPPSAPLPPPPPPLPPPPPPEVSSGGVQPLVTVNAQRADLSLEAADGKDVAFHLRTGQQEIVGYGWSGRGAYSFSGQGNSYTTICTAPCKATLPVGTHHLGLSQEGHGIVEPHDPVEITGPGTLQGTYTSYRGTRIAGVVIMTASILGGTAIMLTAMQTTQDCESSYDGTAGGSQSCFPEKSINGTQFAIGAVVATVGSLVGLGFMLKHDEAAISFVPLSPVATAGSKELAALRAPTSAPQGMALQMRF